MKKRIGYLLLIIISVVGSRLIFGRDYHLNSSNLKDENLYVYDLFDNNRIISTYVDEEEYYYLTAIKEESKYNQYSLIKYNLTSNRKDAEYIFNSESKLNKASIFKQSGYIYLTSSDMEVYYRFDKNLDFENMASFGIKDIDLYGIYKDKVVYTIKNEIYYDDKMYGSVPVSCGKNTEIIYDRDTYLHYYNDKTGFGCLYNLVNKKIEYLDYENVDIIKNKLLEYQSNRLSFKYGGSTYYFNDITESDNIKMHSSGDYLFTIDTANNKLRIYNIESRKIIFEKTVSDIKGMDVSNIMIDDYVFFLVNKNNRTLLYVWDYLKETRQSIDMIDYNEKEYKFKNNELKEEINNDYNIDVYIYDQAAYYFDNYYVVPSYDDILINSRLITLKEVLESFNKYEVNNMMHIRIFFEKDIVSKDNSREKGSLQVNKDNYHIIAVNITNDDFKEVIKEELLKINPNLIENMEIAD